MQVITTFDGNKVRITEQHSISFSVSINTKSGAVIAASGFNNIRECLQFADRFVKEAKV